MAQAQPAAQASSSHLLAAITAMEPTALAEAIKSIPTELETELAAEIRAAKAVIETLEKQAALSAEVSEAREQASALQTQVEAQEAKLKQSERAIAASVAENSVARAQSIKDVRTAQGQTPESEVRRTRRKPFRHHSRPSHSCLRLSTRLLPLACSSSSLPPSRARRASTSCKPSSRPFRLSCASRRWRTSSRRSSWPTRRRRWGRRSRP